MSQDKHCTLLLVEDEVIIAMAEKKALEKYGYNVLLEHSGEDALMLIEKVPDIDIILLDIDLGVNMSGPETALWILKKRNIPIMFLSSHIEKEIVEQTEKITSYGYVVKNSGITVLDASIKMALKLFNANVKIQAVVDKLEATLDALPDLLFEIGYDGYYYDFHSPHAELLFMPREEILGKNIKDVLPENVSRLVMESITEANEKGFSRGAQFEMDVPKGRRWFEISVAKKPGLDSKSHFIVLKRDITERKITEDILFDVIEKNPMSMQIIDKDGYTLKVNAAHTRLFGAVPPPDYCLFTDIQLWNQGLKELLSQASEGKITEFSEFYYNAHDFRESFPDVPVWIRMIIFPIKNTFNNPERFVVMHENVTERKLALDQIQKSEERYRNLIELAVDGIMIGSQEGIIIDANEYMCTMLGLKKDELIGRHISTLPFTKESLEAHPFRFDLLLKGEVVVSERVIHKPNGDDLIIEMRTKMMPDRTYQSIYRDITERRKNEHEIQRLIKENSHV